MELQQWKQNFIRDYLDEIDSLEVMDKLEKYIFVHPFSLYSIFPELF